MPNIRSALGRKFVKENYQQSGHTDTLSLNVHKHALFLSLSLSFVQSIASLTNTFPLLPIHT